MNYNPNLKGQDQAYQYNNMIPNELPQVSQLKNPFQSQNNGMFLSPRNIQQYSQNFPIEIQQPLSARNKTGGFQFPDTLKNNTPLMGNLMNYMYPNNPQQMSFNPNSSQKVQQMPNNYYPQSTNDMSKQVNPNSFYSQQNKQQNMNYQGNQFVTQGYDSQGPWNGQNFGQKMQMNPQTMQFTPQQYQQGFQNLHNQFSNKNVPDQYNQYHHSKSQSSFPKQQDFPNNNSMANGYNGEGGYYSEPQNKYNTMEQSNVNDMSYVSTKSTSRRKKPIVILNIDVGQGRKEEIKVWENDDPAEVASSFCQKFNLPSKVAKVLTQNISQQVDQFNKIKVEKINQKSLNNTMSYPDERSYHEGYSQANYNTSPFNMSMTHHSEPNGYPQTARDQRDPYMQKRLEHKQKKTAMSPFGHEYVDEPEEYVAKPMKKSASTKAIRTQNQFDDENEVTAQFKKGKEEIFSKLYENGMQQQKQKKKIEEIRRASREEEELEGATFHPKVNPASQEMRKKAKRGEDKIEDVLYQEAEAKRERRERAAALKQKLELDGYTFKPEIDEGSQKIINVKSAREKTSKTPAHERLNAEAKLKEKKVEVIKKEVDRENTFKPQIDKTSQKLADRSVTDKNTYERLYKEKITREKTLNQKREQARMEDVYDKNTGQKLYQPNVKKNKYYEKAGDKSDSTFQEEVVEVEGDVVEQTIRNAKESFDPQAYEQPKKGLNKSKSANKLEKEPGRSVSPLTKKPTKKADEDLPTPKSSRIEKKADKLTKSPVIDANKVKDSLQTSKKPTSSKKKPQPESNQSSRMESQESSMYEKKGSRDESTAQSDTKRGSAESEIERQLLVDIFKALDSNLDGKISAEDVDVSALDPEVLDSISEIIYALEDDLVLTVNDFVNMVNQKKVINKLRQVYGLPPKDETESAKKPESKNSSFVNSEKNEFKLVNAQEVSDWPKKKASNSSESMSSESAYREKDLSPAKFATDRLEQNSKTKGLTKKYKEIAEKSFKNK